MEMLRQNEPLVGSNRQVSDVIALALYEDTGCGDATSQAVIPADLTGEAVILVKETGVLAGIDVAGWVFAQADADLEFTVKIKDGTTIKPGAVAATVRGRIASILKGERVALNFLQHLSGVATITACYVARAGRADVVVSDTRKTLPGLRVLEKYAVRMGGGKNHRMHLGDGILIKDNHLAVLRAMDMTLEDIVTRARQKAPAALKVEVEVTTVAEALEVARAGADIILFDNMSPEAMREAVDRLPAGVITEASGGINLGTIAGVAQSGVNIISVGALTHSVKALDLSLEILPETVHRPAQ
jgi:nicotinate-nucleotide pyrophosphorylase (carboxylating)